MLSDPTYSISHHRQLLRKAELRRRGSTTRRRSWSVARMLSSRPVRDRLTARRASRVEGSSGVGVSA